MKISVQLYTLRSLMEKEFWGTLTALSAAGFRNVELAGLGGHPAEDVRVGLAERGLKAHSMHVGMDQAANNIDAMVQDAHTLGVEYVIVPWIDPKQFVGGWVEIGQKFTALSEEYALHDLKFGYHNHAFEFDVIDGKSGFETLWANAGDKVVAELDLYWVRKGGQDPVAWLQRLGARAELAHFKDMDSQGEFTEVGEGSLAWREIVADGRKVGLAWAVIENDSPKIDPLASVIKSREFLLKLGLVD